MASAVGTAGGAQHAIGHARPPAVGRVRGATPPERPRGGGRYVTWRHALVARGVPLGGDGRMSLGEAASGGGQTVGAIRTARLVARPVANGGSPLVLGVGGAPPPGHARRHGEDVRGRRVPVLRRVPLRRRARGADGEVVGAAHRLVRAEGAPAAAAAVVRLRAPDVVGALGATPPDAHSRSGADRVRRERAVALAVPLGDEPRESGYPISGASANERVAHRAAGERSEQPSCLESLSRSAGSNGAAP